MKKKHFIAPALALGLIGGAIAVPSAIFADSDAVTDSANTSTTATQAPATTTTGDHVVTPQRGLDAIDVGITGGATASGSFDIPKGYGHVKLRIKNYSDHTVKVSLTHDGSNKEYISALAIAPHDTVIWRSTDEGYSSGVRSGDYTIQFRGGDYKVDGHVWGVVGTQPGDVQ
ncbi:hypothetical protein [Paenibacillus polymyxa]|uniref:hypothetical protein n=1 Tax=Paenibacillus TaxID=44249 RepID=UPI002024542F|nr:hypothetical protein [Paenibacillus polymyxa]URJ40762.1 hypothetical protein MF627_000260 [Paenibacillus polymyxa]